MVDVHAASAPADQTIVTPPKEHIRANAVYGAKVGLRIGTGGSGQSGLLEALADAFIAYHCQTTGAPHFQIEWYTSDTSVTIQYLRQGVVDVGITYHAIAEQAALDEGFVDRVEYAWRDHWLLVGPKNNPAKLPEDGTTNIYVLMTKLFTELELSSKTKSPIKFLSRYDKSAGNIVESLLWATIGQTPWAEKESSWYHKANEFPFGAITKAAELDEYTVTDYGTWCAIDSAVRDKLMIFAKGKDDESSPLLNPAHLLVGTQAEHKDMATAFANWIILKDGGQKVVREFERHNAILYTEAPTNVDPLAKAKALFGGNSPQPSPSPQRAILRSAAPVAGSDIQLYFFKDTEYVKVDIAADAMVDSTAFPVTKYWLDLARIGWDSVDTWLPIPNTNEAYVFRGSEHILYDIRQDKVIRPPVPWAVRWSALRDAGFGVIDAALPLPEWEATIFFSGDKLVVVNIVDGRTLQKVQSIATSTYMKSLGKAGYKTVETAILKPGTNGTQAYFFEGGSYIIMDLKEDAVLGEPKVVKDTWKCLAQSGFY